MTTRWWFKEQREPHAKYWTWRLLTIDGSIERTSGELKDYGAGVHDAIVNGFRPAADYWVVETWLHTTHYKPGKRVVIIPSEEGASDTRPPRARPSEQKRPHSLAGKFRQHQEQ
jgi:hypothetical protein